MKKRIAILTIVVALVVVFAVVFTSCGIKDTINNLIPGGGDGDGADVAEFTVRVLQGLLCHLFDALRMPAGGDLRDDPAVQDVLLQRGRDDVRQDLPSVFHDRDRGLIAGTLNT